ncbi:CBS domain-containing protein [Clostridium sp. P21]|uniref:CBS domain-containing protein n=1 Tax=Clostridium muellerianum TaxID=2716538 RepID=A0A7Y0EG44_9CLOT|nr:CBS domain-containing protein [Clostridium muellerianum]NMM62825.1 CBS domain-containing protein [Clostridium muellerianum]
MKVKDFMITDVITANENSTIKDVMKTLVINKIGGVPIVNEENKLIGIVSDGDLIRNLKPQNEMLYNIYTFLLYVGKEELEDSVQSIKDQNIMTIAKKKGIYSVNPEDSIEDVLSILSKYHFKKIPVIDNDKKVVGVISRGDVIRYIQKKIIDKL